jgi:hypothetical protein
MFRMMTISKKGNVIFDTFKVGNMLPIQKHTYMFDISFKK